MKKRILIIDDDTYICGLLENFLSANGYVTDTAFSGSTGVKKINEYEYDLILCDYRLPDSDGLKILSLSRKKNLFTPIIIMTAYADVKMAVKLIKMGAFDYVTKPIYPEEILQLVNKSLVPETTRLTPKTFEKQFITGESPQFRSILQDIQSVSPTDVTVLIEGETGTGKEYVARAIHYKSKRYNKPFIAVDCGALPHDLANSELFGHVKGAFTGAIVDKRGYFEQAHGGTLFLDEIGNLSLENQLKMLRVLQEKAVCRLGDEKKIDVDIRIIVATNDDLKENLKHNTFREDLYHRINVVKLKLPPLRERKEDILLFAEKFIENSNREFGKEIKGISDDAKAILVNYPWHGNIRELENVIKSRRLSY
jgi:two-component system response regulator HydG